MIEIYVHEKISPRRVVIIFSERTASDDAGVEDDGPRFCLNEDGWLEIWKDEHWETLHQSSPQSQDSRVNREEERTNA